MQSITTLLSMKYLKNALTSILCLLFFAGALQAGPSKGTNPTACTFSGALGTGDLTMTTRLSRPGAPTGSCGSAYTTPAIINGGPFYYDTYNVTNTTGASQCATFTLTTTDLTNANIQFAVYTNTFNPASLVTNYLADPGISTGTPAAAAGISASVTIPAGANLVLVVYSTNANTGASGTASQYTLSINNLNCAPPPVCTGTPAPGNTITSAASVCPGISFTLTPQNATTGTGVTYVWQSATALAGPYTPIGGATNSSYTTTQTVNTFYRVVVSCSGTPGTSTPVQVTMNPPSACYCIPASSNCNIQDVFLNVTFAGINNTTTCSANGYGDYTGGTQATVIAGGTYPIATTIDAGGNDNIAAWIDYNHNGAFDPSEFTLLGNIAIGTLNSNITIPSTALTGTTRMRLRVRYSTAIGATDPCTTFGLGETEDYTVNIQPCVSAVITSSPSDASVACGSNTSFTASASGSLPAWQWEFRSAPGGIWLNVPNAAPYSGVNTNTLTITGATSAINGYQYRAILSGPCAGATPTAFATLTVTQLVATVTPATATICSGSTQQLTLTNIDAAVPGSVTVNSATLNLNVPDNNAAGVNTSLTVPALPAGAIVTGVRVKLNVTSTWLGDLNVNLKAPNNQILNLDHNLSVTNGNATGGGSFVNTVIGSAFTTPLHTATAPDNTHTGNYKADASTATIAGITPNITGFVPTTASWSAIYTPSTTGVWTIAMADIFGGGDVTTFQNWSITIDYIAGTPSQGVWTGPAGTIFTNAGGTIPYTGTPANSVYVTPANGVSTYSVNFTSPTGCVSTTATSVITVNTVVTGTPAVANVAACANTNAVFSVTGITGGTGLTYQWQVSTPSVPAFTNIAGATASTLTVSGVTAAQNGNQYRVMVGSAGCAAILTSTAGTLTVNPTPVVTISAAPVVNIFPGLTSTLTAAVSSATAPIAYQWFLNGSAVTGATANMYTVAIDGEGRYTVRVTDANGCIAAAGTSTPASITIGDSVSTILFIYPSPNSGRFQVRYYNDINNGGTAPAVVNVYDEKGARVFTSRYVLGAGYNAMNVDMGTHGKGLYRVELLDLNENRIKTGSVLVF